MKALILAGGFGTRLYPLTMDTPKALIKINGKPLIEYTIQKLREIGEIDSIYILSNNKFYINFLEWMEEYKKKNLKTDSNKKVKLLNNGVDLDMDSKGAVEDFKEVLNVIGWKEDLFLIACDNLFDFDLQALVALAREKSSSAVALKLIEDINLVRKYNHIFLNEQKKIVFFEEKPLKPRSNICSTACYFLKKEDIRKIKSHVFMNADNFGEIINFLYKESEVYGYIYPDFWIDIGSFEELEKAREHLSN